MSLDVYLKSPTKEKKDCYHCGSEYEVQETVYEANITHNLAQMADAAGIYEALWRPDENGYKVAGDLIEPISLGLKSLKEHERRYTEYNATNGWGTYNQFVPWVEKYLNACKQYPEAEINVSR